MRLPWKLKRLLQVLVGEDNIYNRASFRPDFSAASFNALPALKLDCEDKQNLLMQPIVSFFARRSKVNAFIAPEQVHTLVEALALTYPQWQQQLLDTAASLCQQGLPIYAELAPRLNRQFPWRSLKKGPDGDQLYLSRPQRFGFAPLLAQAALYDPDYLNAFVEILAGWKQYARTSPYRWPYNSSHALVYRVISLAWSWTFILAIHQKQTSETSYQALHHILDILRNDIAFLAPRLGKAHPNNHLLADYFIGWFIYHSFPELIPELYDFSHYEVLWQQQLLRQFYRDGGCFEHALHYHEHGCEMAIIYCLLSKEADMPLAVRTRIAAMLAFQVKLNGVSCQPWPLGDTTEDSLLPLDQTLGWSCVSIVQVFNCFYPQSADAATTHAGTLKSFWLLAAAKVKNLPQVQESDPVAKTRNWIFKESGFIKFASCSTQNELLFRTGVASSSEFMPGHMHADVLSVFWRVSGQNVLGVSGTASYKYVACHNNTRAYFCGPRAHSCVVIDDQDPLGELIGDFRDKDNGLRVNWDYCCGDQRAYIALANITSDNLYHGLKRGVLSLTHEYHLVFDMLTQAQRQYDCQIGWFFDSAIEVVQQSQGLLLRAEGKPLARLISNLADYKLDRGQTRPLNGWQSKSYGQKVATYYARAHIPSLQPVLAHVLTTNDGIKQCQPVLHKSGNILKISITSSNWQDDIYIVLSQCLEQISLAQLSCLARVCIVRYGLDETYQPANIRVVTVIECQQLHWPEHNIHFSPGKAVTKQWQLPLAQSEVL